MTQQERPWFTGVRTYRDPLGRFTVRHPTDWEQFELDNDRDGVMWAPNTEDPQTHLSVWLTELQGGVVAEDLDELRSGLKEGLQQLPGCSIESEDETLLSNIVKFELVYSFRNGNDTFKRKSWVLYVDMWMMVMTWQGSSVEAYTYWFAMANYCFATFNLPDALWFATDRELEHVRREGG